MMKNTLKEDIERYKKSLLKTIENKPSGVTDEMTSSDGTNVVDVIKKSDIPIQKDMSRNNILLRVRQKAIESQLVEIRDEKRILDKKFDSKQIKKEYYYAKVSELVKRGQELLKEKKENSEILNNLSKKQDSDIDEEYDHSDNNESLSSEQTSKDKEVDELMDTMMDILSHISDKT